MSDTVEGVNHSPATGWELLRHDFHFPGHLLPGTAFIIMGTWWIVKSLSIYFTHYDQKQSGYEEEDGLLKNPKSPPSFPAVHNGAIPGLLYSEGFYKAIYAFVDLTGHLWVVLHGGNLVDESQHMSVYVFFILDGAVNILNHNGALRLPPGTDFLSSALTWTGFGYLFLSHKHGKSPVQIYYHSTLAWVTIAVGVLGLVQYAFRKNIHVALGRGVCCVLAGTWLYQISFTFHNPWNMPQPGVGDHFMMEVMKAATTLTWHVIGILLTVGVLYYQTYWWVRKGGNKSRLGYVEVDCC